jgi:tetratricopeptide (TPR) repeat protein
VFNATQLGGSEMLNTIKKLLRIIVATGAIAAPSAALADACSDFVAEDNRIALDHAANFKLEFTLNHDAESARRDCDQATKVYQMSIDWLARTRRAEAACGARLETECHSDCWSKHVAEDKARVDKSCAEAERLSHPVEQAKDICFNRFFIDASNDDIFKACSEVIGFANADPKDRAEAFMRRAPLFEYRKDLASAVKDFSEAIRLQPQNAKYLFSRALFYRTQKEEDRAFKDLSLALQLDKTNSDIWETRAEIFEGRKDYDSAIADLDQAIKIGSHDSSTVDHMLDRRAYDFVLKGDYDRATKEYRALGRRDKQGATLAKQGLDDIESRRHGPVKPTPMDSANACATLKAYVMMGPLPDKLIPLLVPLCNAHADATVPCATLQVFANAGVPNPGIVCKNGYKAPPVTREEAENACMMLATYAKMDIAPDRMKPLVPPCNKNPDPKMICAILSVFKIYNKPNPGLICTDPN